MRISLRTAASLSLALSVAATPLTAQGAPDLYGGVHGGLGLFGGDVTATVLGVNLFASNAVGALSLSFETMDFGAGPQALVGNPASASGQTSVTWTRGNRLQALLYGTFERGGIEFYVGPGFSLNWITDGAPISSNLSAAELSAATEAIESLDNKLSPVFGGGAQWRKNRFAVFGEYRLVPAARSFLKNGTQMTWTTGIRYSLSPPRMGP